MIDDESDGVVEGQTGRRPGQQRAQMDIAGGRHRDVRASRLDHRGHVSDRPAIPRPVCHHGWRRSDVCGGHLCRQGRVSESRPHGLWQPLRHGVIFGEDYTAQNLVRLATLTEDNIAKAEHKKNAGRPRTGTAGRRSRSAMQAELQGVDLTKQVAVIPGAARGRRSRPCKAGNTDELLGMICQGMDQGLRP